MILFVLVLVNFMWALQFSAAKIAMRQLGPITVTFLPLLMATIFLAPWAIFAPRDASRVRSGRLTLGVLAANFLILGIAGTIVSQLFLTWGIQRSLASNASVLTLTVPILTAVLARLLLGERMTLLRWISFGLAIAGVLVVSDLNWRSVKFFEGRYFWGNLLILLAYLGSAFYNVYIKKLLQFLRPLDILFFSFVVADLVLVPFVFEYEPLTRKTLSSLTPPTWLSLFAIAIFSLTLSLKLFLWVLERVDVTQAILSNYLLPIFGVAISAITVKERLTLTQAMGAALVLASTVLATSYGGRPTAGRTLRDVPGD